jgi:hypothetical protein
MNVAVSRGPERRLIVHDVVFEPAVGREAPGADEVLDPALLNGNRVRRVGVERIIAGDVFAGRGADSVAGVRLVGIRAGLCSILAMEKDQSMAPPLPNLAR